MREVDFNRLCLMLDEIEHKRVELTPEQAAEIVYRLLSALAAAETMQRG